MADVCISAVTEAELRFGVARRPEAVKLRIAVEEFLLRVDILLWDSEAARQYAHVRATLEREGRPMGNLDMMIVSHALATQSVLVSSDRVFRRIRGVRIDDWTKP